MQFTGKNQIEDREMSFIDHLESLRWHIIRSVIAIFVFAILAFINKHFIFDIVFMGPAKTDFWTYRQLCTLGRQFGLGNELCVQKIDFILINTKLAGQFMQHITLSLTTGIVLAFPYAAWELWRFFRPALTPRERNFTQGLVFAASILFFFGIMFGYFVITPITVQFLSNYKLSEAINNTITIADYISVVTMTTVSIALVFELPVVVYFLSKGGLVTPDIMRSYRRHAILIILILSAVLTPSTDMLSQILVGIPFWILYELSIFVSAAVVRKQKTEDI